MKLVTKKHSTVKSSFIQWSQ